MLLAVWLLHFNTRFQDSDNVYVNELQANGLYKFYDAFVKNELVISICRQLHPIPGGHTLCPPGFSAGNPDFFKFPLDNGNAPPYNPSFCCAREMTSMDW